jgi:outer membrane protein OmpA-like peptidoglycan-associated protein
MKDRKMTLKYCIFILCFCFSGFTFSQSIKPSQLPQKQLDQYNEAIKLIRKGKSKEALKMIDAILKKYPNFHEANLRKAAMYYDVGDLKKASLLFEEVIKKDPNYDIEMYNSAAVNAFAEKNYKSSEIYFKKYLDLAKLDSSRKEEILLKYQTSAFRNQSISNPKSFKIEPLAGKVNTDLSEFLPSITLDGNQLIFTRRNGLYDDIYIAEKNNNIWDVAAPMFDEKSDDNTASATISQDGKSAILTICNEKMGSFGSCDLYYSNFELSKWSQPINIGNSINTAAWESQPNISNNGKTLIFSSNRKGSIGGNDLWISYKNINNRWSKPENLSTNINSKGNEESPFLHPDGKTLFFRSTGHIGMGNFDLFYSRYDEKTKKWSMPENLGYPINTEGQEGSLFVDRDGVTCFFATDIENLKKNKKNLDLYTFQLPKEFRAEPTGYIKLSITNQDNKNIPGCGFTIINLDTKDTVKAGIYSGNPILIALPTNKNYSLNINQKDYYFYSLNFNSKEGYDLSKPFDVKAELTEIKIKQSKAIVLNNIFFETGSAILLKESQIEILNLANFLNDNVALKIEILGHTDDVGNDADNMKLSLNRAKAVYEELIKMNISPVRLSYTGKGETMPIAENTSEEGRRKNRRTEFLSK